ncbi:hypothetical protein Cni_G10895 [Canna indica]|uniref:Uncharacterized protein n=1 Tax=Canna indica TaxID=4628 RepID=A0AAQ3QAB7_9LILI|nr:hypothetical protein Cni_G10895 [Canna indica]
MVDTQTTSCYGPPKTMNFAEKFKRPLLVISSFYRQTEVEYKGVLSSLLISYLNKEIRLGDVRARSLQLYGYSDYQNFCLNQDEGKFSHLRIDFIIESNLAE